MAGRAAGHVTGHEAGAAAERVARESYGRLVALLASSTRDIALAEDALADAFERALSTWPSDRRPRQPGGVARDRVPQPHPRRARLRGCTHRGAARGPAPRSGLRRVQPGCDPRQAAGAAVRLRAPGDQPRGAHPAHAPGRARLRRGPHRPRVRGAARVDGTAPGPGEAPHPRHRHPVPGADAHGTARDGCPPCSKPSTAPMRSTGSTSTSAFANRSPTRPAGSPCSPRACSTPSPRHGASPRCSRSHSPGHPHGRARRGRPSTNRTPRLWDRSLIAEGEALLRRAHALGAPLGRFQLEAAIQSAHCDRVRTGTLDRDTRCPALPGARRHRTHHWSGAGPGSADGTVVTIHARGPIGSGPGQRPSAGPVGTHGRAVRAPKAG